MKKMNLMMFGSSILTNRLKLETRRNLWWMS